MDANHHRGGAGGGSGVVPLMAMLRHYARADAAVRAPVPVRLLYCQISSPKQPTGSRAQ